MTRFSRTERNKNRSRDVKRQVAGARARSNDHDDETILLDVTPRDHNKTLYRKQNEEGSRVLDDDENPAEFFLYRARI